MVEFLIVAMFMGLESEIWGNATRNNVNSLNIDYYVAYTRKTSNVCSPKSEM